MSQILSSILLEKKLKDSHSHLIDKVIRDAFTIDFGSTQVVISKKYQYLINKTQPFINEMELIG